MKMQILANTNKPKKSLNKPHLVILEYYSAVVTLVFESLGIDFLFFSSKTRPL